MRNHYTPEGIQNLRNSARRATTGAGITGAVTLLACVLLCLGIRTQNAEIRQVLVIGLTGLGAGIAVWLLEGIRLPALREAAHEAGVLRENAERHQGKIIQIGEVHAIPRSITFLPVTMREGERKITLKLNAVCAKGFPEPGSRIQAETRRGYLVAWQEIREDGVALPCEAKGAQEKQTRSWSAVSVRSLVRHGILCLAAGALLWSWIFNFLTDTDAANKIVLYAEMREGQWKKLAIQLEEKAPEGIRFVQVHPFSYALMDSGALEQADLYIMTARQVEEHMDWIVPLPEKYQVGETLKNSEGDPIGLRVHDGTAGRGSAMKYLCYGEESGEDWYLFFGAQSVHTEAMDGAALEIADCFLLLP